MASDEIIAALRAAVIGRRQPIPVIAKLNDETERCVYQNLDRYDISFIKVGSYRYIDPLEYAEKRGKRMPKASPPPLPPARRVGRPRKSPK